MKRKIKILIALIVGFALAMLLMSVAIYFGYTNAYSTDVNTLTVKIMFFLVLLLRRLSVSLAKK